MSIKRTKQVSKGRDRDAPSGSFPGSKPAEPEKSWAEQMEGKDDAQFVPYALTSKFAKGALIQHASFGKGLVTLVVGPRIEVLFESGTKKLGHAG